MLLAIGGGSVLDSFKAISAMVTVPDSVINYLEVFEVKSHLGTKIHFITICLLIVLLLQMLYP